VVWAGATPLTAQSVHPVVSSGNLPLIGLVGARLDGGVLFNIDLDKTNLLHAPDWPILVSNLVELRRQDLPGPERWNYRAGDWVRIRLGRDPKDVLHYRCGTIEKELPPGRLLEFTAPAPCGLMDIMEGSNVLFQLGVNFLDEIETDLSNKVRGESGKQRSQAAGLQAETGPESDPLFWILLTVGAGAMLANWCLLRSGPDSKRTPRG
jgi:hypothetical protein